MIVEFFHSSAVKSENDEAIFWGIRPTSFGTMNEFIHSFLYYIKLLFRNY